jgi:hypothetical protein
LRLEEARILRLHSPQFVVSIRKGERNLPPGRVEAWADALELKDTERRDFILTAMLPKCPAIVRPYIIQAMGKPSSVRSG